MDYGSGVYHMRSRWKSPKIKEFSTPRMKFSLQTGHTSIEKRKKVNPGDFAE
jgi:hypothetical protein